MLYDLSHFLHHIVIVFPSVRYKAICAILDAALGIAKIAAAFIPQCIQGAIAEKAVKILRTAALMTGKILAFFILEKLIMLHFSLLQILSRDMFLVVGR